MLLVAAPAVVTHPSVLLENATEPASGVAAAHAQVVIYSMSDIPLGFGVTAKSTEECRTVDPSTIVAFHQADVGEQPRRACLQHGLHCIWAGIPVDMSMSAAAAAGEYLRAEDEL